MYEAYAATLVGIVSAAAAILALLVSRRLSPVTYMSVHLLATLLMIILVTFGYETTPSSVRIGPVYLSRLIYLGVSCTMFINTLLIYAYLNRQKGAALADLFFIEP